MGMVDRLPSVLHSRNVSFCGGGFAPMEISRSRDGKNQEVML